MRRFLYASINNNNGMDKASERIEELKGELEKLKSEVKIKIDSLTESNQSLTERNETQLLEINELKQENIKLKADIETMERMINKTRTAKRRYANSAKGKEAQKKASKKYYENKKKKNENNVDIE